jgi:putative peptidoglycan lipid II flippase
MSESRRLAASTAAFGAATAISRVAGLVREMVAAALLGSGPVLSAFNIAFNLPNTVRSIVADNAIGGAFVPVFVELRERGEEREAWRVAGMVLWTAAVVLGAVAALFMLLAPWWVPLIVGDHGVPEQLVVTLTRWLFPIVPVLGMTGVVTGILNSERIFGVPAFAPVIWNLVIIGALAIASTVSGQAHQAEIYAAGVLVATIVQFLIPLPLLRGRGTGLAFELGFGNPHVRKMLRLMVPVSIGLGLININLTIDLIVGSYASGHAVSDLNFAFRVFMLPQGLFSVAVATVLFPEISRLAARGELAGLAAMVGEGMRTIAFLLLPAAAVSAVLAEPIVRLLYQRGQFTGFDTVNVAHTLIAFSAGLLFNGLSLLLTRAFYSLQEPRVPTLVAALNLVVNLGLDIALLGYGAAGIAASTAVVTTLNAVLLAVLLRRRVGLLGGRALVSEGVRIVVATAVAAGLAVAVWWLLDQLLGRSTAGQLGSLLPALAVAAAAYLALARAFRLPEVAVLGSLLPTRGT